MNNLWTVIVVSLVALVLGLFTIQYYPFSRLLGQDIQFLLGTLVTAIGAVIVLKAFLRKREHASFASIVLSAIFALYLVWFILTLLFLANLAGRWFLEDSNNGNVEDLYI